MTRYQHDLLPFNSPSTPPHTLNSPPFFYPSNAKQMYIHHFQTLRAHRSPHFSHLLIRQLRLLDVVIHFFTHHSLRYSDVRIDPFVFRKQVILTYLIELDKSSLLIDYHNTSTPLFIHQKHVLKRHRRWIHYMALSMLEEGPLYRSETLWAACIRHTFIHLQNSPRDFTIVAIIMDEIKRHLLQFFQGHPKFIHTIESKLLFSSNYQSLYSSHLLSSFYDQMLIVFNLISYLTRKNPMGERFEWIKCVMDSFHQSTSIPFKMCSVLDFVVQKLRILHLHLPPSSSHSHHLAHIKQSLALHEQCVFDDLYRQHHNTLQCTKDWIFKILTRFGLLSTKTYQILGPDRINHYLSMGILHLISSPQPIHKAHLPETLRLDTQRLITHHKSYQHLLSLTICLSLFKQFCAMSDIGVGDHTLRRLKKQLFNCMRSVPYYQPTLIHHMLVFMSSTFQLVGKAYPPTIKTNHRNILTQNLIHSGNLYGIMNHRLKIACHAYLRQHQPLPRMISHTSLKYVLEDIIQLSSDVQVITSYHSLVFMPMYLSLFNTPLFTSLLSKNVKLASLISPLHLSNIDPKQPLRNLIEAVQSLRFVSYQFNHHDPIIYFDRVSECLNTLN